VVLVRLRKSLSLGNLLQISGRLSSVTLAADCREPVGIVQIVARLAERDRRAMIKDDRS
jgi:hypothetical protein